MSDESAKQRRFYRLAIGRWAERRYTCPEVDWQWVSGLDMPTSEVLATLIMPLHQLPGVVAVRVDAFDEHENGMIEQVFEPVH